MMLTRKEDMETKFLVNWQDNSGIKVTWDIGEEIEKIDSETYTEEVKSPHSSLILSNLRRTMQKHNSILVVLSAFLLYLV